jgi:putative NADH-flavin reductase
MKLTVFGATGGVGKHVVRQALAAGHQVTAVMRDSSQRGAAAGLVRTRSTPFDVEHPMLEVVTVPGLTDPGALIPALKDSDAAISGIGARSRKDAGVATSTVRPILAALAASGVRRFVAVSAAPVGPVPEGESWLNRRILLPFIGAFARDVYTDLAEMEDQIARSDTEWTVLWPPKLTDKPVTGRYRTAVGANVPRALAISRADTAHAMLAVLDDPRTVRQAVGVAY